jgi:hypothetical protein
MGKHDMCMYIPIGMSPGCDRYDSSAIATFQQKSAAHTRTHVTLIACNLHSIVHAKP